MNVVLWIAQAFVAAMVCLSGVEKLTRPAVGLGERYHWIRDFSQRAVRSIGVVEVTAAAGLILPAATGVAEVLTPIAATGLAVMMALAVAMHLRRKEPSITMYPGTLLVLSAFVAWGRFGPYG